MKLCPFSTKISVNRNYGSDAILVWIKLEAELPLNIVFWKGINDGDEDKKP